MIEHPLWDLAPPGTNAASGLVFDEHERRLVGARTAAGFVSTVWIDDELSAFQAAADAAFPNSRVDVLEWNNGRTLFVLRVTSGTNPGRFFVYSREEKKMREITRSAPWLDEKTLSHTTPFAIAVPGGSPLTGYLTLPRTSRVKLPPVVIKFANGIPASPHPIYDPEAQIFADMGCVVVRLNQRGTQGFGRRFRDELAGGVEKAAMDDALRVLDWIRSRAAFDTKRVALVGEGFAGFLALKILQTNSAAFRCAVAFDAPINPNAWLPDIAVRDDIPRQAKRARLENSNPDVARLSLLDAGASHSRPVFLAVHATADGSNVADTRRISARVVASGAPAPVAEFQNDFVLGLPRARARIYKQLEEFLNLNLYDYNVQLGETVPLR